MQSNGSLNLLYLCLVSCVTLVRGSDVADAFRSRGIVPEIIKTAPDAKITVEYGPESTAELGNTLKREDTEHIPDVSWDSEPFTFYTLIMIDADEKSAVTSDGIFVHWLVSNIPGDKVSSGDAHAEYLSPVPAAEQSHRLIQLLYRQNRLKPHLFTVENDSRIHFSLKDYVKEHDLIGPVAGNFYLLE